MVQRKTGRRAVGSKLKHGKDRFIWRRIIPWNPISFYLVVSITKFHIQGSVHIKLREGRTRFALTLLFQLMRRLSGLESLLLVDSILKLRIQVPVCVKLRLEWSRLILALHFQPTRRLSDLGSLFLVDSIGESEVHKFLHGVVYRVAARLSASKAPLPTHQLPLMSFILEGKPEEGVVKIPSRDD